MAVVITPVETPTVNRLGIKLITIITANGTTDRLNGADLTPAGTVKISSTPCKWGGPQSDQYCGDLPNTSIPDVTQWLTDMGTSGKPDFANGAAFVQEAAMRAARLENDLLWLENLFLFLRGDATAPTPGA